MPLKITFIARYDSQQPFDVNKPPNEYLSYITDMITFSRLNL